MYKMKRIVLLLVMAVVAVTAAVARDKYYRDDSVLPVAARTQLDRHFKAKVSLVKIDKEYGRISEYEVVLTDGTEIEFDKAGNWKSVEVRRGAAVPAGIIPSGIREYVKRNQRQKIVGIEKSRRYYEVELANGVEMLFDLSGNFVKFDD